MSDLIGMPEFERFLLAQTNANGRDVIDEPVPLPNVAGRLGVAPAESFKILDTKLKSPSSAHRDQAFGLIDRLQ